ncbi:MAG: hypothetical protein ACE5QV_09475, partial [Fidelibacterota bacterium]
MPRRNLKLTAMAGLLKSSYILTLFSLLVGETFSQINWDPGELRVKDGIQKIKNFSEISRKIGINTATDLDYKIIIKREGIYKITRDWLEKAGIPTAVIDPRTVKIFNKGEEIPIYLKGDRDGKFDEGETWEIVVRRYSDDKVVLVKAAPPTSYMEYTIDELLTNETLQENALTTNT